MVPMKSLVLLLLAATCVSTTSPPGGCAHPIPQLLNKHMDLIFGDWVLVRSVFDGKTPVDLLSNVSSSHVELRLVDDGTVMYLERNMFLDKTCNAITLNSSKPADLDPDGTHNFNILSAEEVKNGVVTPFNITSFLRFYVTCPDCLLMFYHGDGLGDYLLTYVRDGQHLDANQVKAAEEQFQQLIPCLGFPFEVGFSYNDADFCHKKSSPEAAAET